MTDLQEMALIQARNELAKAKDDVSACVWDGENKEERRNRAFALITSAHNWIDAVIKDPEKE